MQTTADGFDFDRFVGLYERWGEPATRPFAERALDAAGLAPGEHVIDVASGTGVLAVAAAARGASVLATDVAPAMVARAGKRLAAHRGSKATVMGLDDLRVADSSFDAAFSIMGVLAFHTWRDGIDEMVRVTRLGGRVALAMWTDRDDASPAHLLRRIFAKTLPGRTMWPAGFFPSWTRETLGAALRGSGCGDVSVSVVNATWRVRPPGGVPLPTSGMLDECDPFFRGFPGYGALGAADRDLLREPLAEALAALIDPGGMIDLPTEAFVAVGRKTA